MTQSRATGLVLTLLGVCVLPLVVGCTGIGPASVPRDRFDYNGEIARSWKEQILLNIVKTRYLDVPVFLDVTQIVSGYSLERSVTLGATATSSDLFDNATAGVGGIITDRPTITYTPLTGAEFNRNMLTPIPPAAILFTMASGWPVDLVFRVAVRSINGIDSAGPDAPRYDRVLVLLRALQQAQVLGMRVQPEMKDGAGGRVLLPCPRLDAGTGGDAPRSPRPSGDRARAGRIHRGLRASPDAARGVRDADALDVADSDRSRTVRRRAGDRSARRPRARRA